MIFSWQLQLTGWPWWLVIPGAIAGVWALVRLHRREMMTLPWSLRRSFLVLRSVALALLVLFLTEPVFTRTTTEKVKPLVAVLVDQSGSMTVKDTQLKPGIKADASTNLSRHQIALQLARDQVAPALRGQARVEAFSLDAGLSPLDLTHAAPLTTSRATDYESSLKELARLWAREYVGGVVLLTDGRQTLGGDAAPVVRSLRARGALVSGLFVADTRPPRDAVMADISGSSEVFLGENIQFSVRYRISGAPELDWDLTITQGGQEIQRQRVRGTGSWQYATFTFPATNAGLNLYQARLELAQEQTGDWLLQPTGSLPLQIWQEASLANNTAEFSVAVNQDPIKVLLLDSTPRWESRYLAALFERDRRVNLTRRYHAIWTDEKKGPFLPRTQADWDAYDMVCLGDLDSNELPPEQQKCLADFVGRRGGFLVCLAGPRGLPQAFSLGALANVLPIRVALASQRDPEPTTVSLTPAGADHPIMQILNDPGLNQKLWPLLPPLQWMADAVVAKPGATVLLTAMNPAKTPVVALARYGAGRVFWMGTEESWRWRDRLGDRVHQTFWLQAMRWGLAGRLRGQDPRLQMGMDRYLMAPDDTAEVKVRVTTQEGGLPPGSPLIGIEKIADPTEATLATGNTIAMQAVNETPGLWRWSLKDLREGTWRITVTSPDPSLRGLAETRDLVVRHPDGREGWDLSGDLAALTRLTELGGHRTGTLEQTESVVQDLASRLQPRTQEHRQTLRLWSNYVSLLVVMSLLCTEWIWRKKRGLP